MMTTAQNLERIISARNVLRTTAVNFGIALSDAQLAELAEAFGGIINRGAVYEDIKEGESYSIQRGYYTGGTIRGIPGGGNYTLQEKGEVTPTKSKQTVTADSGYYGLSSVIVNAIPANFQDVSDVTATAPDVLLGKIIVTADGKVVPGSMPNNGTVNAQIKEGESVTLSEGYYQGGTVEAIPGGGNYTLQAKGPITPTDTEQTITPDSGYYGLSSVKIAAAAAAPVYTRAESTKF